ncbi:MAG: hypothetical protein J0L63_10775 [Anaerolineae bacterium]|nr:hypothetical protein [Anaerolineae bacterium]
MLIATMNAIFGAACLFGAQRAFRFGWPFLRHGWLMLRVNAEQPDARMNVFRRAGIANGGRFLIGGVLWLVTAVLLLIGGVYFGVQAWLGLYG